MWEKNPDYTLCRLEGVYYLLPFGQCVADNRRAMKINETGAVIWELLDSVKETEALCESVAKRFCLEGADADAAKQDVDLFLQRLQVQDILFAVSDHAVLSGAQDFCYQIGPVSLRVRALPEMIPEELAAFQTEDCSEDILVKLCLNEVRTQEKGSFLVRTEELMVMETQADYLISFFQLPAISEARLTKNGDYAALYYRCSERDCLPQNLFQVLRFLFVYTAQQKGAFVMHSASVLYRGRAWLFSGHSGAGKSTHTNLWREQFDTPVLNGDLNMIAAKDGAFFVYGLPWCGTSGISATGVYPLGGIFFLKQAKENACIVPSGDGKIILALQRLISPVWTSGLLQKNLAFVKGLAKQTPMCRLECQKDPSAAVAAREWADGLLT